MKITEKFVEDILKSDYPENYMSIYESNYLIQYLDKKMKAVHGNSKTRRSLANIYAIYSILYFYEKQFWGDKEIYRNFDGYEYTKLFYFYRGLYGGSKLQNHALNSRVNGEFRNKFSSVENDLIIINEGKYLIHIDYLYVGEADISRTACKIIEKYVDLLMTKDNALIGILQKMTELTDYTEKKNEINALLNEDAEARIFEIIS